MNKSVYLSQEDAKEVVILMLQHLADWPIRSAEAFRNAILGDGMLAVNPMLNISDERAVNFLRNTTKNVVVEGRMIDFGFIPNRVIIAESVRAREPFEMGDLQHPYDTWLGISAWEGGHNGYLITPHPQFTGETLVVEMYGVALPGVDAVLIYDMCSIKVNGLKSTTVSPARMFYHKHSETDQDIRNRGSNSLDPLVTMLRLLADASIPVERHDAPVRLNKARAKQGKFQIPDHTVVDTRDYVARFSASSLRIDRGGHHASPIAHWRRSHLRNLATGKVVKVKSSKVNWRDAEELHRLFYRLDGEPNEPVQLPQD